MYTGGSGITKWCELFTNTKQNPTLTYGNMYKISMYVHHNSQQSLAMTHAEDTVEHFKWCFVFTIKSIDQPIPVAIRSALHPKDAGSNRCNSQDEVNIWDLTSTAARTYQNRWQWTSRSWGQKSGSDSDGHSPSKQWWAINRMQISSLNLCAQRLLPRLPNATS